MRRPNNFSPATQRAALQRQKGLCGSCGTPITQLGNAGRAQHEYGEGARAHHLNHVKLGGTKALDNCVILCESCHYCVHEGGNYRGGMAIGSKKDFPHFDGSDATPPSRSK